MLLFAISFYILLTLLVGVFASRYVKSANDFVLAGKKLPLFLASSTLFATWFGAETILGASSEFVAKGILGVIEEPFGAALCLVLVGAFFAKRLYRMNIITFGDYFRARYSPTVEWVSSFLMVVSFGGWIAAQFVAWGILLEAIAGISREQGIMIGTSVIVLYTYIGGMWAISITDFIQTIIIVLGLGFLLFDLLAQIGGLEIVLSRTPEGFFSFLPEPEFDKISIYFGEWITIGWGAIASQDVLQRVMAAKSEKVAVRSSFFGASMYLTIAFLPLLIGLCAKQLYPELLANKDYQMVLPSVTLLHSSVFVQILFFGALLSAIMSTASGAILAPATVLAENLIKPYLKNPNDKTMLALFRGSVVLIAFLSMLIALIEGNIYELAGDSAVVTLVAMLVPLLAGLWWKRASSTGAMFAMLLGLFTWFVCKFGLETTFPSHLWGFFVSIFAMIAGTWLFPDKK